MGGSISFKACMMDFNKNAGYILTLSLFISLTSTAQSLKINFKQNINAQIPQWEVMDIAFNVKKTVANPFDVTFGATFSGPDNKILNVPGFYNGNDQWILRFSSNVTGKWTYNTFSSNRELSGLSGIVEAVENPSKSRHGAVVVDPKAAQNFMYEDGEPYFALAFELDWLFALDYHNKNDIPRTRQIISDIKNNGFNQVVMNVYAYDVKWQTAKDVPSEYRFNKPNYSPFPGTNDKPDFSKLNVDFFKHLDRVVQHLDQQGIVAHMMIYVWNKGVNWPEMYSKEDNMYYDYVINRYQAFSNIKWDVSKEALDYGRCDIPYINERISRIRTRDAFKRLITVHDYEYCSREDEKVDFISIQSWRTGLNALMLEARNRHHNKPVMNIEHGGYEEGPYLSFQGNYTNAETCLIRNYECVFAGIYSSYYWQDTSWDIVVFDPFNKKHSFSPPRFDYYKHLNTLFNRYNFNTLFPTNPKLTTNDKGGLNNLSTSGYSLSNGKDLFMFFLPSEVERTNAVLPKPENGKLRSTWFNIFTGEFKDKGDITWSGWKEFKSPWEKTPSVLIIEIN